MTTEDDAERIARELCTESNEVLSPRWRTGRAWADFPTEERAPLILIVRNLLARGVFAPRSIEAAMRALIPAATAAWRINDGETDDLHAPIEESDGQANNDQPRLVLSLDLGGCQREAGTDRRVPWQAIVEYDGNGMGSVAIGSGNAEVDPWAALDSLGGSLRAENERDRSADGVNDDDDDFDPTDNPCHHCGAEPGEDCKPGCEVVAHEEASEP